VPCLSHREIGQVITLSEVAGNFILTRGQVLEIVNLSRLVEESFVTFEREVLQPLVLGIGTISRVKFTRVDEYRHAVVCNQ